MRSAKTANPDPEAFIERTVLVQFTSGQLLSRVGLFETPWTAARQAPLSITNSQSLLKLMSIESVMPSSHLILCRPLLLPSIFPSIRVFSNESVFRISRPKYRSFSFSISPSNEYSGLISFRIDRLDLLAERFGELIKMGPPAPTMCQTPNLSSSNSPEISLLDDNPFLPTNTEPRNWNFN